MAKVIVGDQIDLAAEQCSSASDERRRMPIDLEADLIPETRFVEDFPERQVRMRAEKCVDLDRFVVGSVTDSAMEILRFC